MDIDDQEKGRGVDLSQGNAVAGPSGVAKTTSSSGQKRPRDENEEIPLPRDSGKSFKEKGISSMGTTPELSEEEEEESKVTPALKVPRLDRPATKSGDPSSGEFGSDKKGGVKDEEDMELDGAVDFYGGGEKGKGKEKEKMAPSKFKALVPSSGYVARGGSQHEVPVVVERIYYLVRLPLPFEPFSLL